MYRNQSSVTIDEGDDWSYQGIVDVGNISREELGLPWMKESQRPIVAFSSTSSQTYRYRSFQIFEPQIQINRDSRFFLDFFFFIILKR